MCLRSSTLRFNLSNPTRLPSAWRLLLYPHGPHAWRCAMWPPRRLLLMKSEQSSLFYYNASPRHDLMGFQAVPDLDLGGVWDHENPNNKSVAVGKQRSTNLPPISQDSSIALGNAAGVKFGWPLGHGLSFLKRISTNTLPGNEWGERTDHHTKHDI